MKNSYPQNKPLFGRRMTEASGEETQNTQSAPSDEKARLLLLAKEKEEEARRLKEEEARREALAKEEAAREEKRQALLREKEARHAKKIHTPISSEQISQAEEMPAEEPAGKDFLAPKSLQMVTAAMKLKDAYSLEGKL